MTTSPTDPRHRISPKSLAASAIKFAIPALIIGYLLYRVEPADWAEIREQPKHYGLLAAALLVALMAMSLSFVRWCVLVRCQEIELSMLEAFRLGSICFLLSFVSAGSVGGDLFKAIFLAKRRPGKRVEAVASVLVDRGSGLFGLLLLVAAALLFGDPQGGPTLEKIKIATTVLVSAGTAVLVLLIFGGRGIDRLIQRASEWPFVGALVAKIGPPLRMFHHHPIAFCSSIVMSLGVQSMLVLSMWLIANGLYRSPPTLAEHFVIVPIGMLASALPLTPAGLGVLEMAIEWLYELIPAVETEAKGTLVALVFEIVKIVMAIIGTIFYWTANQEVRESLDATPSEASQVSSPAEHGLEDS